MKLLFQDLWVLTTHCHWPSFYIAFFDILIFWLSRKSCRPGPTMPTRSYASGIVKYDIALWICTIITMPLISVPDSFICCCFFQMIFLTLKSVNKYINDRYPLAYWIERKLLCLITLYVSKIQHLVFKHALY